MRWTNRFNFAHAFHSAPWVLPALFVTLVISLLTYRWLARRFRVAPWFVLGFMLCLGSILSITLTPGEWNPSPYCSLRVTFPRPADVLFLTERGLNVWLFVPLGLLLSQTPRPRLGALFFAGAIALPFMIEGLQLMIPGIGRSCQATDIVTNLTGLVLGGFVGLAVRLFWSGINRNRGMGKQVPTSSSGYLQANKKW
jgi:glycopeptide antibiotics resistance protein